MMQPCGQFWNQRKWANFEPSGVLAGGHILNQRKWRLLPGGATCQKAPLAVVKFGNSTSGTTSWLYFEPM